MKISRNTKMGLAVYAIFLVGYCGASGNRLLHHSSDIHFSYQADMFLHGHLELGHPPPNSNDWAEVDYLHLKDGRTVAGTFLRSNPAHFRTLEGKIERITPDVGNVLVEKTKIARNGEIVVALVGGSDTTLKRFYKEGERVRLQPSNATMQPIYVPSDSVEIQGRVIGVLRKY